ncbi:hypothetical protein A9Q84_20450 [Halobacteriovorax marinus]|uniref:Uncharacterized protein n=1 Tax=Halobacteriovorax marinus TaxID=97084 RepID=A0A1Y5F1H1_9BACT|nr:hypothetical protein A9Q84_20450 [Halobacteriovorax marinus]
MIVFQIFSFLFLHVIYSLEKGYSALDFNLLIDLFKDQSVLLGLMILNTILIFMVKKFSYYLTILLSTVISVICFIQFLSSFNKTILFYDLFYIVVAFFFIMIWKLELAEAIYNPNYDFRAIRPSGLRKAEVLLADKSGRMVTATIMNWTKESIFVSLENGAEISGEVQVEIQYQKIKFLFKANIVTESMSGVGLKVIEEKKASTLNWFDFYDIISDRGIFPINV